MLSDTMMLGGGRKAAYPIENSLLFRGAQYLSRTPSVPGNRTTATLSMWMRPGALGTERRLFEAALDGNNYDAIILTSGNVIDFRSETGSGVRFRKITSQVFRDPTAYAHLLVVWDTGNDTASDRVRLYYNGGRVNNFTTSENPAQNYPAWINAAVNHRIGAYAAGGAVNYYDGYLSEPVFIDGVALTPTSFGEVDSITGSWRPKKLTGITWGTNGCYLGKLWDANDLGADYSSGAYSHNLHLVGTNTGTLTMGGGVNAAFDGIETKIGADCAALWLPSSWIGHVQKQWPSAKVIVGYEVFGPTNHDMCGSAGNTVTLSLLGSNTGAFAGEEVILHTDTFTSNTGDQRRYFSGIDVSSPYLFHRVLKSSASGNTYFAQVKLYENGAYGRNTWTATGFTATDVVADTPTNVYATLNPLTRSTYPALGEGNLSVTGMASGDVSGVAGTLMVPTGKWYWEITLAGVGTYPYVGITTQGGLNQSIAYGSSYEIAKRSADIHAASRLLGTITTDVTGNQTWGSGDLLMLALDCDAGKLWFGKNGTWMNNGVPAAGTNPQANWANRNVPIAPFFGGTTGQGDGAVHNFGQRPFTHTPPAGFKPLSTANLPAPSAAAKQPWKYYGSQVVTHDGSGSSFTLGWNPDPANGGSHTLFRVKNLAGGDWYWHDTVRGIDRFLVSNGTAAEYISATHLTSLTTAGASLGSGQAAGTYLVEAWRVSPESGFDIVIDDGTGIAKSVPHNNGSPPKFIQRKSRTAAGSYWFVYHSGLNGGSNPEQYYIYLNDSAAQQSLNASRAWNNQAPTSDAFYVGAPGGGFNWTNDSGQSFVSYVWSEVPGFSKFGSYTGNGNADGPVCCFGFTPAEVTVKRTDVGDTWSIYDGARSPHNMAQRTLYPSNGAAEDNSATNGADMLSSGFKPRVLWTGINANGGAYVYAAWSARCLGGKGVVSATAR